MTQLVAVEMSVSQLSSDPANARRHDERNIETIMASLKEFGQQKPIVVDKSNVVRAGSGTLEAARRLGWSKIICCVSDLVGVEMTAYAIADNRTSELAEWDRSQLAESLRELQQEGGRLAESTGFTDEEIEAMQPDFGPGTEDDQGQLDQLEPKMVTCPNCQKEFDCREQV
jgi:ParB-like chromosome segregation protein Spo0J